ncbi:hypothetical protein T492DRAFT_907634 [Pavlovales sp. CCMP2436]|nr:hypothetical protein T492DRAFT_907634 [Pavlovales sp. CCMP2436]
MAAGGGLCAWCSKAGSGTEQIYTKDAWLARGALLACSSCHTKSYCSRSCQKRHWALHKAECARLKARWLATEGERAAAAERTCAERKRQLEEDTVLVRALVCEIEVGLAALDPTSSLRWAQKRPGRVDVVEVWLQGRKYTGFDTITRHTSVEATLAAIEFRFRTGTFGYGCPCHGFSMMLMNTAGPTPDGGWAPCPFGGGAVAGGRRARAPLGSMPAGFVSRVKPPQPGRATAPAVRELEAADSGGREAQPLFGLTFSCEPCDPEEARELADQQPQQQQPQQPLGDMCGFSLDNEL